MALAGLKKPQLAVFNSIEKQIDKFWREELKIYFVASLKFAFVSLLIFVEYIKLFGA